MNTKQTIETIVTDANGHPRGVMSIEVDFHKNGPCEVTHEGHTYRFSGKDGTHMATGRPTREMATDEDARLWITLDGAHVWED